MPHKHFECPHCEGPVPVELEDLHAASAAPECAECGRIVYVTAGRLSNYQPGLKPGEAPGSPGPSYDSGD